MRRLLLVLSFFTVISPALHAQQFQAEGTITCLIFDDNNNVERTLVKRFVVNSSEGLWKIRTSDAGEANDNNSVIQYTEAGYDGTDIFYLQMSDTNKAALFGLGEALKQKNFSPALGRILKADSPPCLELDCIYPVWLAYCSSLYLSNHVGGKIVAPIWSQSGSYSRPPIKKEEVAKWELNSSSCIKKMEWYSDGTFTFADRDGMEKTEKMPAPYDNGFVRARMETLSETNFNGHLLPQQYVIKMFFPSWDSKEKTNLNVTSSLVVNLDAIRSETNFSCLPALNARVLVKDCRVLISGSPASYVSTTNWSTENQVEAKVRKAGLSSEESKTPFRGNRSTVLLLMVGITCVFLVVVKMINNKNKH